MKLICASHIEIEEVGQVMDNAISEQKPKGSEGGNKVVNLKESFSKKREH